MKVVDEGSCVLLIWKPPSQVDGVAPVRIRAAEGARPIFYR